MIKKVLRNLPVPRYVLVDSQENPITGSFFQDELVKYIPRDSFEIEVMKKRKRGRREEYFVHYIGFPSSMDEWISKKQLITL